MKKCKCGRKIPEWAEICPECAPIRIEEYDPKKHDKIVMIIRG